MEIIIKLDNDEPVKVKTASTYGEQHPEDELHPMDEVIQDLKLENDRLKQREKLYKKYLSMFACHEDHIICPRCEFYKPTDEVPCKIMLPKFRYSLIGKLKKELEAL